VSRELERARDRLTQLKERFDAEEPLTPDVAPDPDPNPGWVVRIPEADDRDDDAVQEPADEPSDERSVDAGITWLQEAARRRLSDER
jgi:hypothetical protein